MRFTVHDSPDYYQLKVSVFNDDKKTELIGETWIALDQIIVPGGKTNDVWHNLNCKGRYAGDIRIELTYYDTRPRDVKAEERGQMAPVGGVMDKGSNSVGGPRQPKSFKRRPLPADPTNSSGSLPMSHTPPTTNQRYAESPDESRFGSTPPPDRRLQRMQDSQTGVSLLGHGNQHQGPYGDGITTAPVLQNPEISQLDMYDTASQDGYGQGNNHMLSQSPYNEQLYSRQADDDVAYIEEWQARPFAQPLQNGTVHSNSSPALMDAQPRQNGLPPKEYYGSSPPESCGYDEIPIREARQDAYSGWPNTDEADADDHGSPPPPPVHRNSGLTSSHSQVRAPSEAYSPIPVTAPLNIRNARSSITASPLSQVHSNSSNTDYPPSISPSSSQIRSKPYPSGSSRTSYIQLEHQQSQSPIRDYDQSMPLSLIPGYEPSIAEDESERIIHEKHMNSRQHCIDRPVAQYPLASAPIPPSRSQPMPRDVENVQHRRAHRSSAPIYNPQAVNPDPRTPVRKSVSPQPGSAPSERRVSDIPFSPDSYDAFNPSIGAAGSVNQPGARYNTPEQAMETSRLHERQEKLGDGPIIGNDGRIIDPSDHLPTDTWAPEPEPKVPRKGPEVTVRFRQSPQGAQPMPAARRHEARPHSLSNPIYAHSPENVSPTATNRARLQKKSSLAMVPLASSPIVPPTNNTTASSPIVPTINNTTPRNLMARSPASGPPLREHENYVGYANSPMYATYSHRNIPPQVPGKIPIGAAQEAWSTNALSEELRSIDIGVGSGQGRVRRGRYGV